ncbi:MAG: PilZ domain-containing protein [Dehalococcoidia bacterium]
MPGYIDLVPGLPLQVFREGNLAEEPYEAAVRSVSKTAIHLTGPRRQDERLEVEPGDRVVVMAAFNGQLFRFHSLVKLVEQVPLDTIVLAPPDEAVNIERRGFYRLFTRVEPRYAARVDHKMAELQRLTGAVVMDISGGGLQLQTREWIPTGSRLRLIFSLDDDALEFDLLMVALSVQRPDRMQSYRVHCGFLEVATADVERVVRHVFRQQVAMRRKGAI